MDESVLLSGKQLDRLKVLHEVKKGHITQRQAAAELGLSTRWVKKLMQRLRSEGNRAVVHRLKGRTSNRRIGEDIAQQAVSLVRENYSDYGPTQATEILNDEHGIQVSRETLRQWLIQAKLWRAKKAKIASSILPLKQIHQWRQRRERRGELVQWDTSEHDWLEGRGPKLYLIAMIDDATSELTARFALSDSTEENMRLMWGYLERHGRPLEFYTDKASLFTINRPLHYNKHLPEKPGKTQIGRALEELNIGWVAAHSPQAKGRIERCFGTLQDRLVKALRRAGANSLESANRYLAEVYLPEWNGRFRRQAANPADAHRPLGGNHRLASILSYSESRQVGNDYTVSWKGSKYQIPPEQARARMRKQSIRVEQRLDGTVWAVWQGEELQLVICPAEEPAAKLSLREPVAGKSQLSVANHRWMKNFWHGDPAKKRPQLPVTPVALRAPSVTGNP